jgi:DNA-directed RNA polymerase subunit RPC12/RpoP
VRVVVLSPGGRRARLRSEREYADRVEASGRCALRECRAPFYFDTGWATVTIGRGRRLYCCAECAHDADLARRRAKYAHRWPHDRRCARCGKEFMSRRPEAQYHSDACRQAAHRERVKARAARRALFIDALERRSAGSGCWQVEAVTGTR